MFNAGAIDWPALEAGSGCCIRAPGPDVIERLRGMPVYLATPVTAWLTRGEPDQAVRVAAEWQAHLLALGLSPISPALLTVPPLLARGDDPVGLQLQAMDHGWWMLRCLPWMQVSVCMAVAPVPGWRESRGVWQEACWFARDGRYVMILGGGEL